MAKSTPIDVLLRQDFYVVINDLKYTAKSPTTAGLYTLTVMTSTPRDIPFPYVNPHPGQPLSPKS